MSGGMQSGGVSKELLTTKGDTHGYSTLNERVPIGSNSQVLTADSTEALGLKWATPTDVQPPTTTKGDLSGFSTSQSRIPVGANNQVLTADSAQSLGLKWATPTDVQPPTTTKGDLSGFSTSQSRIPIGANNQVLTADSAQSLGLKWADAAAGGSLQVIEDYTQTAATATEKTFTVTEDPDDFSALVLDFSIGVNEQTGLHIQINGNSGAGEYETNGSLIDGGSQTIVSASSTSMEICPSETMTANDSTGCGRVIIYVTEAGTTRPSILASSSGQNAAKYYSVAGCMFVAITSVSSIRVFVDNPSFAQMKTNSNMTLYRCAR